MVVDPRGDLAYVLCEGDDSIVEVELGETLRVVGWIDLDGGLNYLYRWSELSITPDGILRVATISPGGAVQVESYDTWNGTLHVVPEEIWGSAWYTGGADISPNGRHVAMVNTDNGTEDYDVLTILEPHARTKAPSTVVLQEDFSSGATSETYQAQDVSWFAAGDAVAGAFYTRSGTGSGGYVADEELFTATLAGTTSVGRVGSCEDLLSLSVNRYDSSGRAYATCFNGTTAVVLVDVDPLGSASPTPDAKIVFGAYYPYKVTVSPDGGFIAVSAYKSGTTAEVFTFEHADIEGGGTFTTTAGTSFGTSFSRPVGVAVTPYVSILAPRPGTRISGIRTFEIAVPDERVTGLSIEVDGTEVCTDLAIGDDRVSDACTLDVETWGAGDHDVTIVATATSGSTTRTYEVGAPYETP